MYLFSLLAICFLFFVYFPFISCTFAPFTSTVNPNLTRASDETCKRMKRGSISVLTASRLGDQILLLTSTEQVFHVNLSQITRKRLNLSQAQAVTFKEKWPKLSSAASGSVGSKEANRKLLLFLNDTNNPRWFNVQHQVEAKSVLASYLAFISTSQQTQFYVIRRNSPSGDLQLARLSLDTSKSNTTTLLTSFYSLCARDKSDIVVLPSSDTPCKEKLHWPGKTPLSGFISNGTVFLFAPQHVLIFPESVFTSRGTSAPMTTTPYWDFILCSGDDSFHAYWPPILSTLLLIILLLSCLLCLFQDGLKLKARKSLEKQEKLKASYLSLSKPHSRSGNGSQMSLGNSASAKKEEDLEMAVKHIALGKSSSKKPE